MGHPTIKPSSNFINCTRIPWCFTDNSYKQATVGDCNVGRPGGWDLKGRMKWDAWDSVRGMERISKFLIVGMSDHEAKERYVSLVKGLFTRQGQGF